MLTKERARYILANPKLGGDLRMAFSEPFAFNPKLYPDGITAAEDRHIREVWEGMPGNTSYYHAIVKIADFFSGDHHDIA